MSSGASPPNSQWGDTPNASNTLDAFTALKAFVIQRISKMLNICDVFNIIDTSQVFFLKSLRKIAGKKTIGLKTETYKKLELYKVDLVKETADPNVTFDDAIAGLLEEHYSKGKIRIGQKLDQQKGK